MFCIFVGEGSIEIRPVSAIEFFITVSPARAHFLNDGKGAVTELGIVSRSGGQVQTYK